MGILPRPVEKKKNNPQMLKTTMSGLFIDWVRIYFPGTVKRRGKENWNDAHCVVVVVSWNWG